MDVPTTLKTRTKAPLVIIYVAADGSASIEGYAYTREAAVKRARRLGRGYGVRNVYDGKVVV